MINTINKRGFLNLIFKILSFFIYTKFFAPFRKWKFLAISVKGDKVINLFR